MASPYDGKSALACHTDEMSSALGFFMIATAGGMVGTMTTMDEGPLTPEQEAAAATAAKKAKKAARVMTPEELERIAASKAKSAAAKAAKGGQQKGKQKQGGAKGGGKAKKAAPQDPNQPDITKLDIRVGVITKVWKHPDAEKLYCEEIDVGEDAPRQIASGLVPHYSLEQMEGRRLLAFCNLKPRNLVGFRSHGMVLCAAKEVGGKEVVEFIDPPADAKVGERVMIDGLTGDAISPAQVEKQKAFVKAAEDLATDAARVATWKGHKFMTSAGPCMAPTLAEAPMR